MRKKKCYKIVEDLTTFTRNKDILEYISKNKLHIKNQIYKFELDLRVGFISWS